MNILHDEVTTSLFHDEYLCYLQGYDDHPYLSPSLIFVLELELLLDFDLKDFVFFEFGFSTYSSTIESSEILHDVCRLPKVYK